MKVKQVQVDVQGARDLALISADDTVWLAVSLKWWDLAALLFFFLCPADRRARVRLNLEHGVTVTVWAVRVAKKHVRLRGKLSADG